MFKESDWDKKELAADKALWPNSKLKITRISDGADITQEYLDKMMSDKNEFMEEVYKELKQ